MLEMQTAFVVVLQLAIVLPAVISIAVLVWLFGTVANITDTLLIFLPRQWTHHDQGNGTMFWYWSLVALVLAVFLIGFVGLPWGDEVLRFHQSPAPSATASAVQVRRPIYSSSVGKWRHHAKRLAPLRARLAREIPEAELA